MIERRLKIFVSSASALSKNIWVQCSPEGPAYAGRISYPENISDWTASEKVANVCEITSNSQFEIEFNGMLYTSGLVSRYFYNRSGRTCAKIIEESGFYSFFDNGSRSSSRSEDLKSKYGFSIVIQIETGKLRPYDNLTSPGFFRYGDQSCVISEQ